MIDQNYFTDEYRAIGFINSRDFLGCRLISVLFDSGLNVWVVTYRRDA